MSCVLRKVGAQEIGSARAGSESVEVVPKTGADARHVGDDLVSGDIVADGGRSRRDES